MTIAAVPILLVGIVGTALLARPQPVDPLAQADPEPSVGATTVEPLPPSTTGRVTASASPDPAFPDTLLGLPVRSVRETLVAYRDASIDGLTAISGYLTLIGPTEDCPGIATARSSNALFCRRETLLADTPRTPFGEEERGDIWAPVGPHVHPVAMPGTYLPAVSTMSIPLERRVPGAVVVMGRFGDPRTGACDMRHLRCDPTLTIEWVPWAAGSYSPPTGAAEPDLRRVVTTLESRDLRRLQLAAIPDGRTMLELLIRGDTLERIDPVAWQGLDHRATGLVWYLRLLDPSETRGGDLTLEVAWLVIDDATGTVIGRGETGPLD